MMGGKKAPAAVEAPSAGEAAAVWVEVAKLVPWAKNPRRNDHNVEHVANLIQRFGFAAPIVARPNGEIIAGHTRIKAALKLGLDKVPVRYMELSEFDAHLLALADNRANELSDWDTPMLQEVFGEFGLDDIALAGWNEDDLKKMASDIVGGGDASPPDDFDGYGEDIETEHRCPKCGYEWSGKAK